MSNTSKNEQMNTTLKRAKMTNKEIRNILENQEVKFTIKGKTTYGRDANGNWNDDIPKVFKTFKGDSNKVRSIISEYGTSGMNVDKFYPTTFTLYTFDILGKQTNARIKYQDVTIITE